ncbi:MAG: Gfo/Idh/MocA family oxidoreductase [Pseudomonadota bacterium]
MSPLGVGIIGSGNISAAYLRLAPMFKGLNMVAVADLNADAAAARATEFRVEARSVAALLASDDIDVVINLTIPAAHFQVTCDILRAGKHAYCEKPVVLTLDEGKALQDLAAKQGLRVGSAPDTFLGASHQQARAMIDEGAIGKVGSGTAHIMGRGMEHWHPNPDFFFLPGAGPVLDMGPYYVTNLIQLLGPVAQVQAMTSIPRATRTILSEPRAGEEIDVKTPTTIHGLLEFACGAVVTLGASWDVRAHRHGHLELYGLEGTLFLPDPNFFGGDLEVAYDEETTDVVDPWDHPFGVANDAEHANYRAAGLADMVAGIAEGRAHRCALDLAVHAVDVLTGLLVSGETGAGVAMTTTCTRPEALGPEAARALLA